MDTLEKLHLLLIENDSEIEKIISKKLQTQGWKVTTVLDGETGVRKCLEGSYDFVLIDYNIPDLGSMEKLRISEHGPPTIMTINAVSERVAVEALGLHVDDYLIKDDGEIFLESIIPAIERTLERKKVELEREDLKRKLEETEEKYCSLIENLNDVIFRVDTNGVFTYISQTAKRLYSYSPNELIGRHFSRFVHPDDYPALSESFNDTLSGIIEPFEFRVFDGQGIEHYVQTSSRPLYKDGQVVGATGVLRDITDRIRAETECRTTVSLLNTLNKPNELHDLMSEVTHTMRAWSGCESVGIRLKNGEDYPYFETRGFPEEFVLAENSLCATKEDGALVWDSLGNPVLECMCGNIIKGRFDPSLPFFTENGSFWTNSTTDLLASTSEEDRQARTRNRCNGEGYESVALIPLRYGSECIGLLQFNDFRRDRFDEYKIYLFERLAAYITLGVFERQSADAVRESEKKYRELVELSPELIAIHKRGNIEFINEAGVNLLCAAHPDQIIGKPVTEFVAPAEGDLVAKWIRKLQKDKKRSPVYEQKLMCVDGTKKYVEVVGTPMSHDGERAVLLVAHDITTRKLAEERLVESEKKWKDILINTPQIGISLDGEGSIVFANEHFLKITGWSEQEVLGQNLFDLCIPQENREDIKNVFEEIIHQKDISKFSRYENEILTKNGERLNISWSNVITENTKGEFADVTCLGVDLTERQRIEDALRESESKFRSITEQTSDLIALTDMNGIITYASPASRTLFQYEPEEMKGHHFSEYLDESDVPRATQVFQDGIEGENKTKFLELKMRRRDGFLFIGELSGTTFRGDASRGSLVVIRDITSRKRMESALYVSEERYRQLFERAPIGIFRTNSDGKVLSVNFTMARMLGFDSPQDAMNHYEDLGAELYVDPERRREFVQLLQKVGYVDNFEYEAHTVDGRRIWLNMNARLSEYSGIGSFVIEGFTSDITQRKEAEEALQESELRYKGLFDSSMDVVFVSTVEGRLLDINKAGEEFFGYSRDELLEIDIRNAYYDLIDRNKFQQAMEEKGYVKDYEVVFKCKDGSTVESVLTATVRRDKMGEILGYQGIIRDVTELKRTQDQLIRAQKMEAIGTLAAGVAHDFNNILSTIMGYSSFLKDKVIDNQELFEGFDLIEKASERASNLTSQLLAYTRRSVKEVRVISLNKIASEVTELISKTFEKSIHIRLKKEKGLPMIEGDESQIYQVIMNCAVNAQHAMPNGGVLEIETYSEEIKEAIDMPHFTIEPGRYVMLKMSDTGIGMKKETLSRIFEPYFTTKEESGGSGLGMSVVFGIVKSHQGYIDVTSESGRGTDVTISFPVSDETHTAVKERSSEINGGTERILIIDDEKAILKMTKTLLEEFGYDVSTTSSGKEGILIVQEQKPDLVLLDLKMPDMDGREVLKELMAIDPKVRVIISTGYVDTEQNDNLIKMGAKGLIKKPFNADTMKREIRRALSEFE